MGVHDTWVILQLEELVQSMVDGRCSQVGLAWQFPDHHIGSGYSCDASEHVCDQFGQPSSWFDSPALHVKDVDIQRSTVMLLRAWLLWSHLNSHRMSQCLYPCRVRRWTLTLWVSFEWSIVVGVKDKQVRVRQNSVKQNPVFIKIGGTDSQCVTVCTLQSPTILLTLPDPTGSLTGHRHG